MITEGNREARGRATQTEYTAGEAVVEISTEERGESWTQSVLRSFSYASTGGNGT